MTRTPNKMSRIAAKTAGFPQGLRSFILTRLFGRIVPFLATASVQFEEVSPARLVVSIKNRRKVQNHIKGVHAAAMALLAETSTGFVMGMNVPDDKLLLLKSMHVDYQKRAQGDLRAVATLSPDQIDLLHDTEKGNFSVSVEISDQSGEAPIQCQMVWAWLPKKRD